MQQTAAAKAAFRQLLLRSVFTPITLMAILAIALIAQVSQLMRSARWVEHTDEVISDLYRAKTMIVDAQASVRGYMLSGIEKDLDSFNESDQELPKAIQVLRDKTSDRAIATQYAEEIQKELQAWREYAISRIELRRTTGKIPEIIPESPGRVANQRMRTALENWIADESRLRGERNDVTKRWAIATIAAAGGLTLGLGLILAFMARGQLRWLSSTYEAALTRSRELSDSLERRVQERTQELQASNGRLNDANKELEAFAYSVSHDLRAPMRHISGFANLLKASQESKLSADDVENLNTIHQTAVQAGRMVDDLLAFSRIGRTAMRWDPLNLDPMVASAANELAPETQNRNIEWKLDKLEPAMGDPSLIRLVFQNLMSNAVKYSGTRDVARIEVGSKPDEGGTTYFVKDNGVGFDMAYAHKLFGVFQ